MVDQRRRLPSVDALLRSEPGIRAGERFGRDVVRAAVREVLDEARRRSTRGGATPDEDELMARAVHRAASATLGLSSVINATGVVLHTGLGRAPLPDEAVRAVARTARAYADLEVDRETGGRGSRGARAEFLLRALTGAEAAIVLNNNAAALVLALAALASRRPVLVSRGELIEIGGEFRLPDIMRASGARLVEVGTTNRTTLADYERVLDDRTAMILKVHPSNFRVVGFTDAPEPKRLAALAERAGIPLVYDVGSGLLRRTRDVPLEEPSVEEALRVADLVCFSGDKLLGGPQAGVIVGRADLMTRLRRHPLARALRVDKMTVAALEAVLRMHAEGRRGDLPPWRQIAATPASVRRRARALAKELDGAEVAPTETVVGGGSLPGYAVPSWALRLPVPNTERAAARLRAGNPPVFCRVDDEALLFDVRTVDPDDDERLARAIRYALAQEA